MFEIQKQDKISNVLNKFFHMMIDDYNLILFEFEYLKKMIHLMIYIYQKQQLDNIVEVNEIFLNVFVVYNLIQT
jgi:hypothetical protein